MKFSLSLQDIFLLVKTGHVFSEIKHLLNTSKCLPPAGSCCSEWILFLKRLSDSGLILCNFYRNKMEAFVVFFYFRIELQWFCKIISLNAKIFQGKICLSSTEIGKCCRKINFCKNLWIVSGKAEERKKSYWFLRNYFSVHFIFSLPQDCHIFVRNLSSSRFVLSVSLGAKIIDVIF